MKKIILLLVTVVASQIMMGQTATPFDNLISTQGYDRTLTFDMNTSPSDVRQYRFITATAGISPTGGSSLLRFQSQVHNNWTTSMTFNSNKIGIGTDYPQEIFDVNGTARTEELIIDPPSGGRFLQMGEDVGNDFRIFNFSTSGNYAGASSYDLSGQQRYEYYHNTGVTSLGIRNTNDQEIFKVAESTQYGNYIHLPRPNSRIVVGDFGSYRFNEGHKLVIKDGDVLVEGNIETEGNIHTQNHLFVDGNVGIGSLNPDAKLAVNGRIHAEEIKVDLNVPADYVFQKYYDGTAPLKEDYRMLSLKEVELFTKENHHLPEVPSAQEMIDNGVEIGEMTNILLQKIEELTLYTIEQEKRIERLEDKIINNKNE